VNSLKIGLDYYFIMSEYVSIEFEIWWTSYQWYSVKLYV